MTSVGQETEALYSEEAMVCCFAPADGVPLSRPAPMIRAVSVNPAAARKATWYPPTSGFASVSPSATRLFVRASTKALSTVRPIELAGCGIGVSP